jgi:hypothetical protein
MCITGESLAPILNTIEHLLGAYVARHHWDLVAELLICYRQLATDSSLIHSIAWKALIDAQTPDGAIRMQVSRSGREQRTLRNRPSPRPASDFLSAYHTTLVAVMASAICFPALEQRSGTTEGTR